MRKIKNILIIAVLTSASALTAQPLRHEFSLNAGGGISTLNYKPVAGKAALGFGGFAGMGYLFRFNEHWGLATGLEVALFNGKYSIASLSDQYMSNDGEEDFEFYYTVSNYRDRQQAILLNIPLMLHFQTGKFYAALGGKAGIPLSAKFNNSMDKLTASGKFASGEFTLNNPRFMGFGEFTNLSNKGNLTLKTALFASAEAGIRWRLSNNIVLSTGLYVDYGVNNIRPPVTAPLIAYAFNADYQPNSLVTSTNANKPFIDKLNPIAVGIKIGIVFGAPTDKASKATPDSVAVAPVAVASEVVAPKAVAPVVVVPETKLWIETTKKPQITEEPRLAEQKRVEEPRVVEEPRLAEQKRVEEPRITEKTRLVGQKRVETQRLTEEQRQYAIAREIIRMYVDGYSLNGTALSASQKFELDGKAALLLEFYPKGPIVIEGHACNIGIHSINVMIGRKRAENVKNYLIKKGIAANRMTVVSKAEREPIVTNTSEANRKKNRRVMVRIE
ncbi:hypothetical protein FACS1894201_00010 [Bacteroidia bacterium]|nr:hypothetical protein FACS1894201_00010 [Bacteroidia bacterium]